MPDLQRYPWSLHQIKYVEDTFARFHHFLHRFWVRNVLVTFAEKPWMKINMSKKHKSRISNLDLIRQTFKLWITHILWKKTLNVSKNALCPRTSKIPSAWVRVLGTTVSLVPWRSIILRGDPGRSPYPSRGDAATGAMDANISLKCGE